MAKRPELVKVNSMEAMQAVAPRVDAYIQEFVDQVRAHEDALMRGETLYSTKGDKLECEITVKMKIGVNLKTHASELTVIPECKRPGFAGFGAAVMFANDGSGLFMDPTEDHQPPLPLKGQWVTPDSEGDN